MYLGIIEDFELKKKETPNPNKLFPIAFRTLLGRSLVRFYKGEVFLSLNFGFPENVSFNLGKDIGTITDEYHDIVEKIVLFDKSITFDKNPNSILSYKTRFWIVPYGNRVDESDYGEFYYFYWIDRIGRLFIEIIPNFDRYDTSMWDVLKEI